MEITIAIPDVQTITSIIGLVAGIYTVYQEYRHRKDNGTIKPHNVPYKLHHAVKDIREALHQIQPNNEKFKP